MSRTSWGAMGCNGPAPRPAHRMLYPLTIRSFPPFVSHVGGWMRGDCAAIGSLSAPRYGSPMPSNRGASKNPLNTDGGCCCLDLSEARGTPENYGSHNSDFDGSGRAGEGWATPRFGPLLKVERDGAVARRWTWDPAKLSGLWPLLGSREESLCCCEPQVRLGI